MFGAKVWSNVTKPIDENLSMFVTEKQALHLVKAIKRAHELIGMRRGLSII
jgi:hypothetical protein